MSTKPSHKNKWREIARIYFGLASNRDSNRHSKCKFLALRADVVMLRRTGTRAVPAMDKKVLRKMGSVVETSLLCHHHVTPECSKTHEALLTAELQAI